MENTLKFHKNALEKTKFCQSFINNFEESYGQLELEYAEVLEDILKLRHLSQINMVNLIKSINTSLYYVYKSKQNMYDCELFELRLKEQNLQTKIKQNLSFTMKKIEKTRISVDEHIHYINMYEQDKADLQAAIVVEKKAVISNKVMVEECIVCYTPLVLNNMSVLNCNHNFCIPCYDKWVEKMLSKMASPTCPNCRTPITTCTNYIAVYDDVRTTDIDTSIVTEEKIDDITV